MQHLGVARNSCENGYFWDSGCASPKCLIPFIKTLLYLCICADLCDYIKEQNEFLVNKTSTYEIPKFVLVSVQKLVAIFFFFSC